MHKLTALLAVLLAGLPAASLADIACDHRAAVGAASGRLAEDSSWGTVTEQSFWPGAALHLSGRLEPRLCADLDVSLQGGPADYDGYTQFGLTHVADAHHLDLDTRISLRRGFTPTLDGLASLGHERFDRHVWAEGFTAGIIERYRWTWLGFGVEWRACPGCRNPLTLRARYETLVDGESHVDVGALGSAEIDFDDSSKITLEADIIEPRADSRWPRVTLSFQERAIAESASFPLTGAPASVFQPAFKLRDAGVWFSWPLR